jgi:nitroreductase
VRAIAPRDDQPARAADHVLTTTRAVRRRLDLERPVDPALVRECIGIALQAPTGGNDQGWHFVVVTDPASRAAVAEVFRAAALEYAQRERPRRRRLRERTEEERATRKKVMASSAYLFEHLHEVPVLVIPCIEGRTEGVPLADQATTFASIYPAVWSFMLAARSRGLGTSLTTAHLEREVQVAEILGIPHDVVTQAGLVPVAHTVGSDFKPGSRRGVDDVVHWDRW